MHSSQSFVQNYLMGELESLGLSTIKLNELNDNYELHGLVRKLCRRPNSGDLDLGDYCSSSS